MLPVDAIHELGAAPHQGRVMTHQPGQFALGRRLGIGRWQQPRLEQPHEQARIFLIGLLRAGGEGPELFRVRHAAIQIVVINSHGYFIYKTI